MVNGDDGHYRDLLAVDMSCDSMDAVEEGVCSRKGRYVDLDVVVDDVVGDGGDDFDDRFVVVVVLHVMSQQTATIVEDASQCVQN